MSSGDSVDAQAKARELLHSIGAHARSSNQHRVGELSQAVARVGRGELSALDRERAVDVAHQLVGSAGTFGWQRASALAREVELFLRQADAPDPVQLAAAMRALALVEQDLSADPED